MLSHFQNARSPLTLVGAVWPGRGTGVGVGAGVEGLAVGGGEGLVAGGRVLGGGLLIGEEDGSALAMGPGLDSYPGSGVGDADDTKGEGPGLADAEGLTADACGPHAIKATNPSIDPAFHNMVLPRGLMLAQDSRTLSVEPQWDHRPMTMGPQSLPQRD